MRGRPPDIEIDEDEARLPSSDEDVTPPASPIPLNEIEEAPEPSGRSALAKLSSLAKQHLARAFQSLGLTGMASAALAAMYRIRIPGIMETSIEEATIVVQEGHGNLYLYSRVEVDNPEVSYPIIQRRYFPAIDITQPSFKMSMPDLSRVSPDAYKAITAILGAAGATLYYAAIKAEERIVDTRHTDIAAEIERQLLEGQGERTSKYANSAYKIAGSTFVFLGDLAAFTGVSLITYAKGTPLNKPVDGTEILGNNFHYYEYMENTIEGDIPAPYTQTIFGLFTMQGGGAQFSQLLTKDAASYAAGIAAASLPLSMLGNWLKAQGFRGTEMNKMLDARAIEARVVAGVEAAHIIEVYDAPPPYLVEPRPASPASIELIDVGHGIGGPDSGYDSGRDEDDADYPGHDENYSDSDHRIDISPIIELPSSAAASPLRLTSMDAAAGQAAAMEPNESRLSGLNIELPAEPATPPIMGPREQGIGCVIS